VFKKNNKSQNYQPNFPQPTNNQPYPSQQYPQYPQGQYPQQSYPPQYASQSPYPTNYGQFPNGLDNENRIKNIEKEVKKIFGSETRILLWQMIISLICLAFLGFVIVTRFLETKYPSEAVNKFFSNNQYSQWFLIFPIVLAILFLFSFVKSAIDRGSTKKAIKIFKDQLMANSSVFTMPGTLPNIVKKLTLKQVTRSWIAAYFVTAGLIFASVLFFLSTVQIKEPTSNTEQILQGIQKIVSEFLTKHFKNPQLVGILMYVAVGIVFVLGLINYLVIRKRLANIDAVFGQVYRREIDIDRIRSKRHFICFVVYFVLILFPVVIVVLLLRKRRAKK
jgi:Ni,Fe-hydrogenase I cytochrome b subunit